MSISFDPSRDLIDGVDGLEPVTLRRRESGVSITLSAAWRRDVVMTEAEPSGGVAQQADATWYLQLPAEAASPQPGDVVIDANHSHWTVFAVENQSIFGRHKCSTRELRVSFGCDDYVDVQRAQWNDLGEGPVIVGWTDVYTAMPVRIQPDKTEVSDTSNAPTSTDRFTIILGEPFPLESDDRFVGTDGAVYRLESLEQQQRIDKLPIAKVVRVST